jgi:MFS transporter, DHA2 family, methylenomycin A resistance protein
VTLLYQDIFGWSPLKTGLSWLFMNVPFLVLAQLTGRLDRRVPRHLVILCGCFLSAVGFLALGLGTSTTPFLLAAFGYFTAGAGFGLLTPGITHIAMRDVPAGVSGAGSGILNAARQIGTSVGLAVLGAIGMSAAISTWTSRTHEFAPAVQQAALAQSHNVAGGRLKSVTTALGPEYCSAAMDAFLHGYHLAVCIGAGGVALAALVGFFGLRPDARESATAA